MDLEVLLSGSAVALLILEGVKWLVRLVKKTPEFTFPKWFYLLTLPTLQILVQPLLVWLEVVPAVELAFSVKTVVQTFLGSLVSVVLYAEGYKPLVNPE